MNKGRDIKSALYKGCAVIVLMIMGMQTASAGVTTGPIAITQIEANAASVNAGVIYLYSSSAWPNPGGCSNTTKAAISISESNYNILMTMIYDAYSNGDLLNFNITNGSCITVGSVTYPRINQIFFTKS